DSTGNDGRQPRAPRRRSPAATAVRRAHRGQPDNPCARARRRTARPGAMSCRRRRALPAGGRLSPAPLTPGRRYPRWSASWEAIVLDVYEVVGWLGALLVVGGYALGTRG